MSISATLFKILLISSVFAFVAVSSASATVETTRQNKLRPSEAVKKAAENRSVKFRTTVERIFSKFENRIANYEKFLTRVKTRKEKLANAGKNTDKLDAFVKTAETNLENAKTTLADSKKVVEALDYTGQLKDVRASVMNEVKKVRQALTTLHKSMSQAVQSIKEDEDL